MIRWPEDRMARSPDDRMARRPYGRRPYGQKSRWHIKQILKKWCSQCYTGYTLNVLPVHHQLVSTSRLKFESNGGFTFSDNKCFNRNIHYGRLIGVQIYERKIKKFYSIQNMRIIYGSWDILAKLMAYVGGWFWLTHKVSYFKGREGASLCVQCTCLCGVRYSFFLTYTQNSI